MLERRETRVAPANGLAGGASLRNGPLGMAWMSTFHLRWWRHLNEPRSAAPEFRAPAAPERRRQSPRAHPQSKD